MNYPLKRWVGEVVLKHLAARNNRIVKSCGLGSARRAGILFCIKDENSYQPIKEFVAYLKRSGVKEVKAIGYVLKKQHLHSLTSSLDFDFFTKSDLNWCNKPVSIPVNHFIEEEYDLLIDLTMEEHLPLRFLLGISKARFKLGAQSVKKTPFFDLMINIKDKAEQNYLISQIDHYLKMIDNKKA